ncbi:MAG: efflux RND transporter periplasmic adaptor subunit [Terrimonas sp.]|nr:efflux RND transporter periplasmic adaptor subunit [Terrimonas sp.]
MQIKSWILTAAIPVIISACGGGSAREGKGDLSDKKAKLEQLKKQHDELNQQITNLQEEINRLDPLAATGNARLVTVSPLSTQEFNHFIELQGKVDAEDIAYVTPRGGAMQAGQVKAIYVKEGSYVKKGQLLLKLDDGLIRKQIEGIQTQLNFAKDIYQRQQNLWKENIGTEVQLLTAKTNVESLEKQLGTVKEQLDFTNVYAEMSGIADEVNIRVGEIFTGAPPMDIRIVNTSNMKIMANIPENYITRVHKGTPVQVIIPDAGNRVINSTVSLISQTIDPSTRGFVVEAKLSNTGGLKPNQVAIMKILDYSVPKTIVVPLNTIQSDEKGRYVFVMEKKGNRSVAVKRPVVTGESFGDGIEIKSGLQEGEQLVTQGYQNLYEGQSIAAEEK